MIKRAFYTLILCAISMMVTAQELKPTESKALIRTVVKSETNKPLSGEQVSFTSKKSGARFDGITDLNGKFSILLPIGQTYNIEYKNFTEKVKFNELEIPAKPAMYTWDLEISFQPSKVVVLKNVEFDFNMATIRPSSFSSLNDLAEVMMRKPNLVIEVGGHTDNVGTDESNQVLSQNRANAIKQYLIRKGVKAERIIAVGYGEGMPIADNEREEGRQKNRRTEVKIIKE